MRSSGSSASASTTWRTMGRPQRECSTFGVPERMRVPSPAARTTALKGRYCFMRAPFGLGGEGSNLDSGLQRTLCCRYTTPECSHRRDYDADNSDLNAASPEPPAFAALVGVALAPHPPLGSRCARSGSVASRHGLIDQEAPQAHAEEEAQEAAEEDPLAASSAGQVSSGRPLWAAVSRPDAVFLTSGRSSRSSWSLRAIPSHLLRRRRGRAPARRGRH